MAEDSDPLSVEQLDSLVDNTFKDVQSTAQELMIQDPSAFMLKMQKAFDVYSLSFEEVLTNFEGTNTDAPQAVLRKLFHGLKYQLFYMFDFTIQQITFYQETQAQLHLQLAAKVQEQNESYNSSPYDLIHEQIKRELQPILPGRRQVSHDSPTRINKSLSTITEVQSSSAMSKRPSEEELKNAKGNTSIYSNVQVNSASPNKSNLSPPDPNFHQIQMNDTHERHMEHELEKYNKDYIKTQLEIERVLYKSKSLLEKKKSLAPDQLERALEDIEKTKHKIKKIEKEFSPEKKHVKITEFHLYPKTTVELDEFEDEESEEDLRNFGRNQNYIRHGIKPKTADFEQMTEGPGVTELENEVAYLKEEMRQRLEKKDATIDGLHKEITRTNTEAARMKKFFIGREDKLTLDLRAKESENKQFKNEIDNLQRKVEDILRYHGGSVNTTDRQRSVLQKYIKKLEEEIECYKGLLERLQREILLSKFGMKPEDIDQDPDDDPETRIKKIFQYSKLILGDNAKAIEYFELASHAINKERTKLHNEIKLRDEAILNTADIKDDPPEPTTTITEIQETKPSERSSMPVSMTSGLTYDMSHIKGILSNVSPSSTNNVPKIQRKLMQQTEIYEKQGRDGDGKKKNAYYVDKITPRAGVPMLKLQDVGSTNVRRNYGKGKTYVGPSRVSQKAHEAGLTLNLPSKSLERRGNGKPVINPLGPYDGSNEMMEHMLRIVHNNGDLISSSPMMESMERVAFSEIDLNDKSIPTEDHDRVHSSTGLRHQKSLSTYDGYSNTMSTVQSMEPTYRGSMNILPTITVNTRSNSPNRNMDNLNVNNASGANKKGSYSTNHSPVPQRPTPNGLGQSHSQKVFKPNEDKSHPGTPKAKPAPIITFEPNFFGGGGGDNRALPLFQFTPSLSKKKNQGLGENLQLSSPSATFHTPMIGSHSSRSLNATGGGMKNPSPRNFKNKISLDVPGAASPNIMYFPTVGSQSTRMHTIEEEIISNDKKTNIEELQAITQTAKEILQKEEEFNHLAKNKEDQQMVKLYKMVLKKSQYDPAVAQFLTKVKEDHEMKERASTGNTEEDARVKKLNFDNFKKYFDKVNDQHKTCGPNCIHLLRFFSRVGLFNPVFNKRKPLGMKISEVRTEEILGKKAVKEEELQIRGSFVGGAIHRKTVWP